MNFFQTLSAAIVGQSMARKTRDCYFHHARQFYAFSGKAAGQWEGGDVRRWLLETTMIYLQADAARGFSPLDVPPPARVLPFAPGMRRLA